MGIWASAPTGSDLKERRGNGAERHETERKRSELDDRPDDDDRCREEQQPPRERGLRVRQPRERNDQSDRVRRQRCRDDAVGDTAAQILELAGFQRAIAIRIDATWQQTPRAVKRIEVLGRDPRWMRKQQREHRECDDAERRTRDGPLQHRGAHDRKTTNRSSENVVRHACE